MKENYEKAFNIGIVGLGLIGGSFARSFSKFTPHRVFGRGRALGGAAASAAVSAGAVSGELTDEKLSELDVLIFAVNPRTTVEIFGAYLPLLKSGCVVLDAGGVKRGVVAAMEQAAKEHPALQFVGAHPMAGREISGFSASTAELFMGASCLLVPVNADSGAVDGIKKLLFSVGFKNCKVTSAAEHDKMIAFTSQLCHAISASYCLNPLSSAHDGYSAGSFRDLTRVARLSAPMWTELFCDNADELSAVLSSFIGQIDVLRQAIERRDEDEVYKILSAANCQRLTFG